MAIKFISVKCPECGANLPIEEGRNQMFCSYCGTSIIMSNENEYIYRHINEAAIKQAETDREIELKKIELSEKRRAESQKAKKFKIILSVIIGIIMLLGFLIGSSSDSSLSGLMVGMVCGLVLLVMWVNNGDSSGVDEDGTVKVPRGVSEYHSKSYSAIEAMFKSAGFTNVQCIPLHDLKLGLFKRPNTVESITINGRETTSGGKKYDPSANIIITYHSY